MRTPIRRFGNSKGIILPKPILSQLNFGTEVEIEVKRDAIVLRRARHPREGWAEAAAATPKAKSGPIWPEFSNDADAELKW